MANKCGCEEKGKKPKEQFIAGKKDNGMMTEIIELPAIKKKNEVPI